MKLLFCTDGSQLSYNALINATKWLKYSKIDIIHSTDWISYSDIMDVFSEKINICYTKNAEGILNNAENYLKEHNIEIKNKIMKCNSPVESILTNETDYDIVILGSNGKTGIQRWFGSVSQEVASSSKKSVYISKGINKCENILITIDFMNFKDKYLEKCLKNVDFNKKNIHLLSVYNIPEFMFLEGNIDKNWINEIEKNNLKSCIKILEKVENKFNISGQSVKVKSTIKGTPANEIIKYATKNKIDLIVTGSRHQKYFSMLFSGSVSKKISDKVKSDILIIK